MFTEAEANFLCSTANSYEGESMTVAEEKRIEVPEAQDIPTKNSPEGGYSQRNLSR